ncbi:Smr/MutS family protein [Chloroflexota bacterium]
MHRLTVDEALPKLGEFLHAAYQVGLYRVWVVHGKGTGVLR